MERAEPLAPMPDLEPVSPSSGEISNMSRTARLWKGAGPLAVGGLLLSGVLVRAAEPPPLSQQLSDLGRQALARGAKAQAQTFFRKALELDPANNAARQGLDRAVPPKIRRVALQAPATPPPE